MTPQPEPSLAEIAEAHEATPLTPDEAQDRHPPTLEEPAGRQRAADRAPLQPPPGTRTQPYRALNERQHKD